jgi:hypothetical protein
VLAAVSVEYDRNGDTVARRPVYAFRGDSWLMHDVAREVVEVLVAKQREACSILLRDAIVELGILGNTAD